MSNHSPRLDARVFDLDAASAINSMATQIRSALSRQLSRRGLVVAISGGIDSSVCAALGVRALGPDKVYGLLLPEKDSSASSSLRGKQLAEHLGIAFETIDITSSLEAIGCYESRDEAIRRVINEYGVGWKSKIVIAGGIEGRINHFHVVAQSPTGDTHRARLGIRDYLQIVAATNFKQRIRKCIEYFHADRLHYAVVGTPNRLEYDQGFFVKNGDGSADVKPIAHLYKTQVYALARHMQLPDDICNATPTTDTYSLEQGQDEFYFALPYQKMDLALWAYNHHRPANELAKALDVLPQHAENIYLDIAAKRRATKYLHQPPILLEPVFDSTSTGNAD